MTISELSTKHTVRNGAARATFTTWPGGAFAIEADTVHVKLTESVRPKEVWTLDDLISVRDMLTEIIDWQQNRLADDE